MLIHLGFLTINYRISSVFSPQLLANCNASGNMPNNDFRSMCDDEENHSKHCIKNTNQKLHSCITGWE